MTSDIALILAFDGIATGAIYALVGLGMVLIFSVTRVVFVPFGDIVAFSALTLASLESGRVPGTVYLVSILAVVACVIDAAGACRNRQFTRIPPGLISYGLLPLIPVAVAWSTAGSTLPGWARIPLAVALVVPVAPLLDRIVFRPMADASVLMLLIVSVALHFGLAGLGLIFFGPEGSRTVPLTDSMFVVGDVVVTAQVILMISAALVSSIMLFLFFQHTTAGKALRATALNRVGARIVGIRPSQTGRLAFTLASLLGAISGILIGPVTTIYYDSGFLIGLKAFVGAIIGAMASYPLTVAGALFVGLIESFASFWSSAFKEIIVFSLLIPVLIWRSVLLGHVEEEDEEISR